MDVDDPQDAARGGARYNRIERSSDADRVLALQLEESTGTVDGRGWQAIVENVWHYAAGVLTSMIRNGEIWVFHRRLGGHPARDLALPLKGVRPDDAHDLAIDVTRTSLPVLRDQLREGRWAPDGGASIRTWFVNLCILRFPPVWRSWRRASRNRIRTIELSPEVEPEDPERADAVIYRVEFERFVSLLDDEAQAVVRLDAAGYRDAEIAGALGLTDKTVEYRLSKARRVSRARREREFLREKRDGVA